MESRVYHDFIPDLFKVSPMCKVGGAPTPEIIDEVQSAKLNNVMNYVYSRCKPIYYKSQEMIAFEHGNHKLPDGTVVKTLQEQADEIQKAIIKMRQELNAQATKALLERKMKEEAEEYFRQLPKHQHAHVGMDPDCGVYRGNLAQLQAIAAKDEPLTIEKLVAARKKLSDEFFTQAGYAAKVEEQQRRIANEVMKVNCT